MQLKAARQRRTAFIMFILTGLFFAPYLLGQKIVGFRDLSLYFYPFRYLMVQSVLSGHWPLWNPYIYGGYPLLASLQAGFFYPFTWILYFLPFGLAFNYYTILHYFLAGVFMFYLARHWGQSQMAALLSGIVFMFSGYLVSVSNMNTSLTSVIWLPLLFVFFDKLLEHSNWRQILAFSLVYALTFLGGEPTIIYISTLALLGYGLMQGKPFLVNWKQLFLALGLAGLLVAVQLLPFLELLGSSVRTTMTGFAFIAERSFPPREVLNLILPNFFGNFIKGTYSEVLVGKQLQMWLLSPYVGILPVMLAVMAFFRREKKIMFLGACVVVSLGLAAGKFSWLYMLAYKFLPGISLIRYPVKYFFLAAFALPLLAGFGLDNLLGLKPEQSKKALKIGLLLFLGFIWLDISMRSFPGFFYGGYRLLFPQTLHFAFEKMIVQNFQNNLISWLKMILELGGVLALAWLWRLNIISRSLFSGLLVSVIALDLMLVNQAVLVPVDHKKIEELPGLTRVFGQDHSLYRVFADFKVDETPVFYGNYDEAVAGLKERLVPNLLVINGVDYLFGRESIEPQKIVELHDRMKTRTLKQNLPELSKYNVKYIVTAQPQTIAGLKLINQTHRYGSDLYLYLNQKCLPRVCYAGESSITKYENERVVMQVHSSKKSTLILRDAYAPGWQARVDGCPAKVYPEGVIGRAIEVPAGKHHIEMYYAPLSFKLGAIISLITAAGMIVLWIKKTH